MVKANALEAESSAEDAVFPVILQILEDSIFNASNPLLLGCEVKEGIAKVASN